MKLYRFSIDEDLHPKGVGGVVFGSNKLMAYCHFTSRLHHAGLGIHSVDDYTITKIQVPAAFILYPPK